MKRKIANAVIVGFIFGAVPVLFHQVYFSIAPVDMLFTYDSVVAEDVKHGEQQRLQLYRNPQQGLPRMNSTKLLEDINGNQVHKYTVNDIVYEYEDDGVAGIVRTIPTRIEPGTYRWVESVYLPVLWWERLLAQVESNYFEITE